jgi:hypothetical protein
MNYHHDSRHKIYHSSYSWAAQRSARSLLVVNKTTIGNYSECLRTNLVATPNVGSLGREEVILVYVLLVVDMLSLLHHLDQFLCNLSCSDVLGSP